MAYNNSFDGDVQVKALAEIAKKLLEEDEPELLKDLRSLNYAEREKILEYIQNVEKQADEKPLPEKVLVCAAGTENKPFRATAFACGAGGLACLLALAIIPACVAGAVGVWKVKSVERERNSAIREVASAIRDADVKKQQLETERDARLQQINLTQEAVWATTRERAARNRLREEAQASALKTAGLIEEGERLTQQNQHLSNQVASDEARLRLLIERQGEANDTLRQREADLADARAQNQQLAQQLHAAAVQSAKLYDDLQRETALRASSAPVPIDPGILQMLDEAKIDIDSVRTAVGRPVIISNFHPETYELNTSFCAATLQVTMVPHYVQLLDVSSHNVTEVRDKIKTELKTAVLRH